MPVGDSAAAGARVRCAVVVECAGLVVGRVQPHVLDAGGVAAAALLALASERPAHPLAVREALCVVVQPVEAGGVVRLLEPDDLALDRLDPAARLDPAVDGVAGRVDKLDIAQVRPRGRVGGL